MSNSERQRERGAWAQRHGGSPSALSRTLWDDGDGASQCTQSHLERVDAVDVDRAACRLNEAKEHEDERRLARAGAADDAALLARFDGCREAAQRERQAWPVAQ
jgi:hypothetical protein